MKKLILMAAVMLSVLPAAAQEQASKFDASYIQVWGQAEKEITPDEFYLSVTINEKDSKGKISIQTQERAMLDALKKLGVDTQKQLRVVDMSSEYFKKGNALAWKQFQLKLNTPEQVAQVFGSLNDLGISNVSMEKVPKRWPAPSGRRRANASTSTIRTTTSCPTTATSSWPAA